MSGPGFPRQLLNRFLSEPAERPGDGPTRRVPLTPQQRALVRETAGGQGGGRVAQLAWPWHGPLDAERFTAAWRSVVAGESVLRTAVEWAPGAAPQAVVHEHVAAGLGRRRAYPAEDFDVRSAPDRLRTRDPRRPAPVRLALVDAPAPAPTRVLLTFDRVLLDGHSAVLLLHQLCRAYLADGRLPGGERRPDFGDYVRWLDGQSTSAAREFWAGALAAAPHTALPGTVPAAAAGHVPGARPAGGRAEVRLSPGEAEQLCAWGAEHAVGVSILLQAAWALVLYGARHRAPEAVGFGARVSGRSVPLAGVERLPGRLTNVLPVTVGVDPAGPVAALLDELRDWALDTAAYEWVATDQIRRWSRRAAHRPLFESQVVYSAPPRMPAGLETALAAWGIRPGTPDPDLTPASVPALSGRPAPDGGLVLALRHDGTRLTDAAAAGLVERCASVLRALCRSRGGTTVGELLVALG